MRFALLFIAYLAGCGDPECPPGSTAFGERCVVADAAVDGADGAADGATDACVSRPEECNGLDDDCDGMVDEGLDETTFYLDADEDTYGDDAAPVTACTAPPNHIERGGDCDDEDGAINPDALELCDGIDQDCDLAVDEGLIGPVGMPSIFAPAAPDSLNGSVDVAGYEAGYVVVYADAAERLQLRTMNSVGTPTALRSEVDPGTIDQVNPAVGISGAGGASRAVVAWSQGNALRARVFPLDGTTPTDAVDVATGGSSNSRAEILSLGDDVVIVWNEFDTSSIRVLARTLDPITGIPGSPAVEVFDILGSGSILSARVPATVVDAPMPFVLAAMTDQRPGDLYDLLYLRRFWMGASGLEQDAEPYRYPGPTAQAIFDPRPIVTRAAPDGSVSVGMLFSEDDASVARIREQRLTAVPRSAAIEIEGDTVDMMVEGIVVDRTGVPGGVWAVSVSIPDAELQLITLAFDGTTAPGAAPIAPPTSDARVLGASISAMSPSEGAVVFTRPVMGGGHEHVFQRIACE